MVTPKHSEIPERFSNAEIWRGLKVGGGTCSEAALPTGFGELDRYLPGGGWPQRAITEIFLDRYGIGELSLLMPALAGLSGPTATVERWVVWVAPPFIPYAPALTRCGVDLSRVLLVHPKSAERDTLWAVEQAIRSKSSVAVLAWLANADHTALRRLQLGAEENRCWTVLFRPLSALRHNSPAALRLKLSPKEEGTRIDIVKCRGRRPETIELENFHNGVDECRPGRVEWR